MVKIKNPMAIVSSGGSATLVSKTITANGPYNPADDNADGYSDVTVAVPVPANKFKSLVDRSITSVTAEDLAGVTNIGIRSFYGCDSLVSCEIPDSVTSIGADAFYYCTMLQSLVLPAGVASIGASAFRSTYAMQSITILATEPPALANSNAFGDTNFPIYVPAGSVTAYQSATNWSAIASRIQAIV